MRLLHFSRNAATGAMAAAVFAIVLGLSPSHRSMAADDARQRLMVITGTGEVSAEPDIAHITSGVVTEADTARTALSRNNAAMTAIFKEIETLGIARKDFATSGFNIGPRYRHHKDGRPPEVTGYQVSNQIRITIRDLDRLGGILDRLVTLGSNTVGGISFGFGKPDAMLNEARRLAVNDARAKAVLYAEAAGVELGPVVAIAESGGNMPRPVPHIRAMKMEAADAVPVARGEQSLSAEVSITWEIR